MIKIQLSGLYKHLKNNKGKFIAVFILFVFSICCLYFIAANDSLYSKTIAEIISVTQTNDKQAQDIYGNTEEICTQHISAVILNGNHKDEVIYMTNNISESQVFDTKYDIKDKVFITYHENSQKAIISASILDLKRDKYMAYILAVFLFLIILVGGKKGLRALASVAINIFIAFCLIKLYIFRVNVFLIITLSCLIFIVFSILLVNGRNQKSYAAILGTLAGTFFSLAVTLIVIYATNGAGMHYEEMDFLPYDSRQLFAVEVIIGTLGGIMDIAITISAAVKELSDKSPDIDKKSLIKSGKEIGKDIMGSMANTLIFAYISGSIPMIIIWLKNGYSVSTVINFNLSLEIIRALTGSIGIVISIPITIYISVFLICGNRTGAKA
ncbi:putative membrane protein [Ruminiclostridium sufflavum DSM 19573]|uniref:Putative membrane protein n=1 Tax=Ruminiclostridium sufflavum DSM 19573 TaxID=1121337 RepID=A0A318XJ23_9FIRM|nr:YibE/F family protein [Ruminiclostridium sufflavum]PYG85843.1 putative membrane protein [Ruminiclostridium sufflavum DSM 19573]